MSTSYKNSSDINVEALVDDVTESAISISYEHHEMHDGSFYFYKSWLINTGATDSYNDFMFITPDTTKRIHARFEAVADADAVVEIYEAPTTSANGTEVNTFNVDRNSENTPTLIAYASPTVTAEGTLIWATRNGGGKNPVGVNPVAAYEIIAKQNTKYLFRLTKKTTADTVMDINFYWYEHELKSS